MTPACRIVVNIDTDPDPPGTPQSDAAVLAAYGTMRQVLDKAGVQGAWSVLTGPICRTRFMAPPFLQFWRALRDDGADLVLHTEEDLYGPPADAVPGESSTLRDGHMRGVIAAAAASMRAAGLPFAAIRGGYHGLTPAMAQAALDAGIAIDLSCAPGIDWPERGATWASAPRSAFRMAPACPGQPMPDGPVTEIPWATDDGPPRLARRFVVGESFMINEFSTLEAMRAVWDAVRARAALTGRDQAVSMMTHSFAIGRPECRGQLEAILAHIRATGGVFATPREVAARLA